MTEYVRGWIGYDAECAICRGWAARTHKILLLHGFHFVPLQSLWAREKFNLKDGAPTDTGARSIRSERPLTPSLSPSDGERVSAGRVRGNVSGLQYEEMKLLTADGRIFGGADALIRIARSIWWAWPVYVTAQIPGVKPLLRVLYRWLARNRHCFGNQCRVSAPHPKSHLHITSTFYDIP